MRLSQTSAKQVLAEMWRTGEDAITVTRRLDVGMLPEEEVCRIAYETVAVNPEIVLRYRDGETKLLNVLVGKVMGQIRGRSTGAWVEECVIASITYMYRPFDKPEPNPKVMNLLERNLIEKSATFRELCKFPEDR